MRNRPFMCRLSIFVEGMPVVSNYSWISCQ
jgi:hypothetical protein